MSEQQNKWRSIIESANALTPNEIINNGSIMYVDLLEERTVWHIHVELEEVVEYLENNCLNYQVHGTVETLN